MATLDEFLLKNGWILKAVTGERPATLAAYPPGYTLTIGRSTANPDQCDLTWMDDESVLQLLPGVPYVDGMLSGTTSDGKWNVTVAIVAGISPPLQGSVAAANDGSDHHLAGVWGAEPAG
jgi:hypothetical protein